MSFSSTITAYEDSFFHLWKERRLPEIIDPLDPKLKEFTQKRARLAQLFEKAAEEPIGFVLPLRRIPTRSGTPRWTSQPWFLLGRHACFSLPGDSPMGYRLPLEALPWTRAEDVTYAFDTDPFRRSDKLPPRPERHMGLVLDGLLPDRRSRARGQIRAKPKPERRASA